MLGFPWGICHLFSQTNIPRKPMKDERQLYICKGIRFCSPNYYSLLVSLAPGNAKFGLPDLSITIQPLIITEIKRSVLI